MTGTFDVRVIGSNADGSIAVADWSNVQVETCEGCGFSPLLPVLIRDRSDLYPDGAERRAWWEPVTDGGAGEHTPERCRARRRGPPVPETRAWPRGTRARVALGQE